MLEERVKNGPLQCIFLFIAVPFTYNLYPLKPILLLVVSAFSKLVT